MLPPTSLSLCTTTLVMKVQYVDSMVNIRTTSSFLEDVRINMTPSENNTLN